MKYALIIYLISVLSGCSSSSSDSSTNALAGNWLSNCYARTDENGVLIAYAIDNLAVTDDVSTSSTTEYTDINCAINNENTFTLVQNYTLGELVATTDGTTAQRITFTSDLNYMGQPIKITIENIYRISGVELIFGDYMNDHTPTLDYSVTYVKQ